MDVDFWVVFFGDDVFFEGFLSFGPVLALRVAVVVV